MTIAELIWKGTKPSCLPIFKKTPPNSLGSASYCIRTMTQNTLPEQWPKTPGQLSKGINGRKWKVLDCPSQSPDLNLIKHEFHQLKRKGRNSPKQATIGIGCIKGWEKYLKGWGRESGDVYGSSVRDLQLNVFFYICLMFNCPNIYAHINEWDEL